jgi:serine phosphatase RsbU (regulator of sigma subunit)
VSEETAKVRETPRTDAALLRYTGGELVTFLPRGLRATVDADFARELEREVRALGAAARTEYERAEEAERLYREQVGDLELLSIQIGQLKESLASAEASLKAAQQDAERLNWLENEVVREQEYLSVERSQRTGPVPNSLFRRNVPITRASIDAAMKDSP